MIHGLDDASQMPWLEERGIALVRGHGRLTGERPSRWATSCCARRARRDRRVGTAPLIPPVPGLRDARPWTNREAVTAQAVPGSLVVVGGGPVGCELAQAFATLGADVTLVEVAPRILLKEEPFAADEVRSGLRGAGVTVHEGVEITRVERGADGRMTVQTDGAGTLTADELLCASGRRHLTGEAGLETVGVEADGPVEVGDDLRVPGFDWLYVVGDANGRALLTHEGKHQARIASDVICGRDARVRRGDAPPPRVTFTEPQVAAVGHTEQTAREAGLEVKVVDVPSDATAGASFHGRGVPGTSRLVVDEARRVIVGATFVGADVAEWVHAASIAVAGEVSLDDLWHALPAFPTRSEIWLKLLEGYGL